MRDVPKWAEPRTITVSSPGPHEFVSMQPASLSSAVIVKSRWVAAGLKACQSSTIGTKTRPC